MDEREAAPSNGDETAEETPAVKLPDPSVPAANVPAHFFGEEEQYDPSSPRCGLCHKPMRRAKDPEQKEGGGGTPIEGMKYFHADCLARLGPGGRGL